MSWNVAGRVSRLADQLSAVLAEAPDVVALQEVTVRTLPFWRAGLAEGGLVHVASTLDAGPPPRPRRLGVLLAAREPFERLPGPELPWPERVLCGRGRLEVVVLHSPISPSPDLAKVRCHEAVAAYLAAPAPWPRLLCGDLNTPRREHPDGSGALTFARDTKGRLRPERGERWDAAELSLVRGLPERHGWTDAFRALHGYADREATWAWPSGGGWRLDHVLLSPGLRPSACTYRHEWRLDRLSDHSGVVADVSPG